MEQMSIYCCKSSFYKMYQSIYIKNIDKLEHMYRQYDGK